MLKQTSWRLNVGRRALLFISGMDAYDISNEKTPGGKTFADQNMTLWRPEYLASLVAVKTWNKFLFQHIFC